MLKKSASCAPLTASSRSQSSHTTMGELPPCGARHATLECNAGELNEVHHRAQSGPAIEGG